jgi:hypothetical protein
MPPHSAPHNRRFGLSGAGKGSAERSQDWRKSYDEINWPKSEVGFTRDGNKLVKRYGPVVELPVTPAQPQVDFAANMRFGV